ncbi:MAG: hypothetical protein Tsb0033_01080 [Winogradskyella sp.]
MNISFCDSTLEGYETLDISHYKINYSLESKEIFQETENHILFLDSNYSENHIKNILSSIESFDDIFSYFRKDGVIVLVNKQTGELKLQRDIAGLSTIYYHRGKEQIVLSSNVHNLGNRFSSRLNKKSVYQLLYFDFLWDGQTIYDEIRQLTAGSAITWDKDFNVVEETQEELDLNNRENDLSEEKNIKKLRKEIVEAHRPYINSENIVFLSGGIDSVAMLIALDDLVDKDKIKSHSFRVKGTEQDETTYAKSISNHLKSNLKIIERDFTPGIEESSFKNEILKTNNPYPGMWIFGNQINDKQNTSYYAGQDTRLHTPALNILDKIAFKIFALNQRGLKPISIVLDMLLMPVRGIFNSILRKRTIHNKKFLGLRRLAYIFNTKAYLNLVYFKLDKAYLKSLKLPTETFDEISKNYDLDVSKAQDERTLYNVLVAKKWSEQYVNDIRYMVDMVKKEGGKLAMPFYDINLARYSSTIPFKLANRMMSGKAQFDDKKIKVNKYVLRQALSDKIDQKTFLRSKAVSRTGHLIFTQGLDKLLRKLLIDDLNSIDSFIKEFRLENFLNRFLNKEKEWEMYDDKYLLKVYHTACLCIYKKQLNNKKIRPSVTSRP